MQVTYMRRASVSSSTVIHYQTVRGSVLSQQDRRGGGEVLRLEGGREGPERGACCADPAGSRPLWPRVPEMPYCPQMGECQQPRGWARGPSRGDSDSVTRRPCNGKEPGM